MKPKTIKQLPEAWLCLQKHTFLPKILEVVDSFDACEAAETRKGKSRSIRVEKDSPELRVQVDGINIVKPHHITMRENWLKRNHEFIKPCLANAREAIVFTWAEGAPRDVIGSRLGGDAPLMHDEEWHCCEQCGQPFTYVGTIDFRDTPYRSAVPADAMTYFQCFNFEGCDWFLNAIVGWLHADEQVVLKSPPQGSRGKTFKGTPWLVNDYSMDDTGYFDKDEDELAAAFDMSLVGGDPYFSVSADAVKIGGHPFWIQNDESQDFICSCGKPMSFIAQFMEPDGIETDGISYIVVCATNKCESYGVIVQSF